MGDWLLGTAGTLFQGICYFFAAVVAVWGGGIAVWKLIGDNHATLRDAGTVFVLTAIGVLLLALLGAFIPTLLGGGV